MSRYERPAWHEAYDAQMALWRWYRTERSREWMVGLGSSAIIGMPRSTQEMVVGLIDGEMGRLIDCDPIYVSRDMVEVVDVARESFQPEPLQEWDLPTTRGFLYWARPIIANDRHGQPLALQAVSWARQYRIPKGKEDSAPVVAEAMLSGQYGTNIGLAGGIEPRFRSTEMDAMVADGLIEPYGIGITLYCEREDYLDGARLRAALAAKDSKREQERMQAQAETYMRQTAGCPVIPMHVTPWWFNMTFDGNEVDALGEATAAEGWWRIVQTTLRLMMQKKPAQAFGRPDRPTRRGAERLGFPKDTEVVIVRLRREEHPRHDDSEPSGRTLNYRHLRTGHWRNQWYQSEQVHRQIWIDPTIVGDESLPLLVRPRRVFQWTR